jgi:hypothetical protein
MRGGRGAHLRVLVHAKAKRGSNTRLEYQAQAAKFTKRKSREENTNVALIFPHEYPSTGSAGSPQAGSINSPQAGSGQACGENKRHGFQKECVEALSTMFLGIAPRTRRGIFGSGTPERKCRDILFLPAGILCELRGLSLVLQAGVKNLFGLRWGRWLGIYQNSEMRPWGGGRTTKFFYEFEPYCG